MIKKLTDAVAFIGAANVNMVKLRKQFIKRDLPLKMKGLCRDEEFSGKYLFGDNLNAKIKEVSELNKVTLDFKKVNYRTNNRGVRGSYRGGMRGFRGRRAFRFSPYNRSSNFTRRGNRAQGNRSSPFPQ